MLAVCSKITGSEYVGFCMDNVWCKGFRWFDVAIHEAVALMSSGSQGFLIHTTV